MNPEHTLDLDRMTQKITYRPKERMVCFRSLTTAERSAVFNALSPRVRQEILRKLSVNESVELLDHLDLRRAHYVLDHMKDDSRRKRIISQLKNDLHAKVEYFLQFHPQASASLVHLNYVLLSDKTTIGETAEIIEDYLSNTGKIPEVIVSQDGNVVGEIPFSVLIRESNSSKLRNHIHPIKTVPYTSDHEEIITTFTSEPHKKVILLDSDGSMIGVVYSDDIIDFLEESPAASLYSFAGVKEGERPFDSTWSKVSRRYKWLIVNLVTVLIAGGVVALFENTLTQIVFLAAYLPIVAGMGSNASTQTLAVMVRGIAQGEITFKNGRPAIVREVNAGLLNGIFNGVLVAIIAIALGQSPLFGLVVGISLLVSLVVAGFFGAVTPLILRRLGKDPATSAGVLISTATDVIGFITLLGLATLILL